MTSADSYRKLAAELKAKASNERKSELASELDNLARCYLCLAEQSDMNSHLDGAVEFGRKNYMGEGGLTSNNVNCTEAG